MKPINWVQFTWDLSAIADTCPPLPEHYQIALATPADEKELRRVISSSFSLDPDWNASMKEVMLTIEPWLDRAEQSGPVSCLALRHGSRIIGASVLSTDASADNHLAPGPCVLIEYRNRGLGTHLLHTSLTTLRDAGLGRASAISKENSLATKFLYTKFNSTHAPHDDAALAA
ncbi:MAG: GNAT family N-acetyltransferase [Verrucomicrobiota bacterium]|nr:GNAT family N-acetyltransferase [Verrucomicrobiota bacterium]